jgi:hypothetical protein
MPIMLCYPCSLITAGTPITTAGTPITTAITMSLHAPPRRSPSCGRLVAAEERLAVGDQREAALRATLATLAAAIEKAESRALPWQAVSPEPEPAPLKPWRGHWPWRI